LSPWDLKDAYQGHGVIVSGNRRDATSAAAQEIVLDSHQ
jgi:hypothetical protein